MFFFLATGLVVVSSQNTCTLQSPSLLLKEGDETVIDYSGVEVPYWLCVDIGGYEWACGSTKWNGTYTRTAPEGFTSLDTEWSYRTESKLCSVASVCESIAGGTSSCSFAEYSWEKWLPTSCDADNDYDAWTETYNVRQTLSCCAEGLTTNCNSDEDYDNCVEDADFSDYLAELNTCWTATKKDFMKTLLCEVVDTDIFNWYYNCTNSDGSWKSDEYNNADCQYRATCSEDIQNLLVNFGSCACNVASDLDYAGDYITTAMSEVWESVCPGLNLTCDHSGSGLVTIMNKYYIVGIEFNWSGTQDDDEVKNAVIGVISNYLNVHNDSITVSSITASGSNNYWSIEITVATDDDADIILADVDDDLEDDIASELESYTTGSTISEFDSSKRQGSTTTTATYEDGSSNKIFNGNFILLFVSISSLLISWL